MAAGHAGWFVQARRPLTDAQLSTLRARAADAGLSIESRDSQSGLATTRTRATVAGRLLALGILARTVGVLRGESSGEVRALALLAVVLAGACAYAALITGYWPRIHDLDNVPTATSARLTAAASRCPAVVRNSYRAT
jgi:putative ABC transport system permease protein